MNTNTTHHLWWIFGEPREERGELAVNFYYEIGKHCELRLPVPIRRFSAAGDLRFRIENGEAAARRPLDLSASPVEIGKRLYQLLGAEPQTTLIRSFSNLAQNGSERILYLVFPPASPENREWSVALEDLPWELLHDGEQFISQRYSLLIVRSHTHNMVPGGFLEQRVSSWRILLACPFVFADKEQCREYNLDPLPNAVKEVETLCELEQQTNGLICIEPSDVKNQNKGIRTFAELEDAILSNERKPYHFIHYTGHGVIYRDEPCLCFESENGGIDYVSIDRMRQLCLRALEAKPRAALPSIIFLNACSSSSRGRYSAGLASGLHDLGLCVLGYHSEVQDDEQPRVSARRFYHSLCLEQSLKNPSAPALVTTAIRSTRNLLRSDEKNPKSAWGNLRAYLPTELKYYVQGRGWIERTMQGIYSNFAQWMNPADYTDHLSIGFFIAILFGAFLGIENLVYIFPQSVLSNYLNYNEIVSELIRIFLVGPLSFLAAAFWAAWQARSNHQFLVSGEKKNSTARTLWHCLKSLPAALLAGVSFSVLFSYSFSRMDLLTSQTKDLATIPHFSVISFWYGLVIVLGIAITVSLLAATWISCRVRDTLHSYRTFHIILYAYLVIAAVYIWVASRGGISGVGLIVTWLLCALINIFAYSLASVKVLKEISWRSYQKSRSAPAPLSWRKLLPLFGGVGLAVLCYILLEESVRFNRETITNALIHREQHSTVDEKNRNVQQVLERALRERVVMTIPPEVEDVVEQDWLLCVIHADYNLYRSMQNRSESERLLNESLRLLNLSVDLSDGEVRFKDYYGNIRAMVLLNLSSLTEEKSKKEALLTQAVSSAAFSVEKDRKNFAYLDTLARAEYELAVITDDPDQKREILSDAVSHVQEAEWSSFFLRSYRAAEIQDVIRNLRIKINDAWQDVNPA